MRDYDIGVILMALAAVAVLIGIVSGVIYLINGAIDVVPVIRENGKIVLEHIAH